MTATRTKDEKQAARRAQPWNVGRCISCNQRLKPFASRIAVHQPGQPANTWIGWRHAGCAIPVALREVS